MQEIGSDFHLTTKEIKEFEEVLASTPELIRDEAEQVFFMSGRQGIRHCLQDIEAEGLRLGRTGKKIALLPEYTCESLLAPFWAEGYDLAFYPVDQELTASFRDLDRLIDETGAGVLLVHPYFGFDTLREPEAFRKDRPGLKVLFDDTQSWAGTIRYPFWDYKIVSLRKWGPLPDGAAVWKKSAPFIVKAPSEENQRVLLSMKAAYRLKDDYLSGGSTTKQELLTAFRESNGLFSDLTPRTMSRYSRLVLDRFMKNQPAWQAARQNNYRILAGWPGWDSLGRVLYPELKEEVPLYFPVCLENRRRLQQFLAGHGVFCPVIWPVPEPDPVPVVSATLARTRRCLLTIPIDQRYGTDDMERILQLLDEFISQE